MKVEIAVPEASPDNPSTETLRVETCRVLGLPLACMDFRRTVEAVEQLIRAGRPQFFITANLHYAMLSDRLPELQAVNRQAAFLTADGMPLVWLSRLLGTPLPERVTGADLIWALSALCADRGWSIYLLGGGPGVAEEAAAVLQGRYPTLRVVGTESPTIRLDDRMTNEAIAARIREARPELLFAALGQPKGELWLRDWHTATGVPVAVQVGASFDFVCGRKSRAPGWLGRLGLEWMYRLLTEPRRLGPRYFADAMFLCRRLPGELRRARRNTVSS
ncbi:WecB/TagA/CpsF family glycosyltransferase [Thermostilla marina]